MKNFKNKIFMLLFAVLVGCSVNAYSGSPWDEFILKPDRDSLVVLKKAISASAQRCAWGRTGNENVVWPWEKHNPLFELIVKGNESAFRAGLVGFRCLGGGELWDFYMSAGLFFEKQPHTFLTIAHENSISDRYFKSMVRMLPEYTIDKFDLQILLVKKRIALLQGTNEDSLERLKKLGLSVLEGELEELNRIIVEIGKADKIEIE